MPERVNRNSFPEGIFHIFPTVGVALIPNSATPSCWMFHIYFMFENNQANCVFLVLMTALRPASITHHFECCAADTISTFAFVAIDDSLFASAREYPICALNGNVKVNSTRMMVMVMVGVL